MLMSAVGDSYENNEHDVTQRNSEHLLRGTPATGPIPDYYGSSFGECWP